MILFSLLGLDGDGDSFTATQAQCRDTAPQAAFAQRMN
jgi:hypothetical protein